MRGNILEYVMKLRRMEKMSVRSMIWIREGDGFKKPHLEFF